MKRTLAITVSLLTLGLMVYAGDYLLLRYRIAQKRNPFGSVTVYRYYAVAEKNQKTEYVFDKAEAQTCVHTLFPHLDYRPCWYLNRHAEKQTNL
jgi:hypothetical protein